MVRGGKKEKVARFLKEVVEGTVSDLLKLFEKSLKEYESLSYTLPVFSGVCHFFSCHQRAFMLLVVF